MLSVSVCASMIVSWLVRVSVYGHVTKSVWVCVMGVCVRERETEWDSFNENIGNSILKVVFWAPSNPLRCLFSKTFLEKIEFGKIFAFHENVWFPLKKTFSAAFDPKKFFANQVVGMSSSGPNIQQICQTFWGCQSPINFYRSGCDGLRRWLIVEQRI